MNRSIQDTHVPRRVLRTLAPLAVGFLINTVTPPATAAAEPGTQSGATDAASSPLASAAVRTSTERRVAASADDAEQSSSGSMSLTSSRLQLIHDSSDQIVGMRWRNLGIPQGAVITGAYIQFFAAESQTEATSLVFRGQASDNAPAFTSSSKNVSGRSRTSATVNWKPSSWRSGDVTATQRTPDLKAIVQEIVGRPGWAANNGLAIIVNGTGHRTAVSYDQSSSKAPLLHVDYTTTQTPADAAPVAKLTVKPGASSLAVIADGSGSTDVDATPIKTYRFDFGDGSAAVTTTAPVASASHTYASSGTHTVTLIATDTGGNASAPVSADITLGTGTSSVGPVAVYAGYYDTHHPGHPRPKPSPWLGASNVTFVGRPDAGTSDAWDSSCIRIDNLGSSTLSGVAVTVTIGSRKFALWSATSIDPGRTLILAQTAFENFDGSDTSPAGCYGCDPKLCVSEVSSTQPVVHVTVNGKLTDYTDSGQTLNTQGVDGAGCPATGTRNDESRAWTLLATNEAVKQTPTPGSNNPAFGIPAPGALALAPLSPNPTRGALNLHFSLPRSGPASLGVYDIAGRLVKSYLDGTLEAGEYRGQLDIAGAVPGMYFVRLSTSGGILRRSFVMLQ